MKTIVALLTSALFVFPSQAFAQTASPSPSASPAPLASSAPSPSPAASSPAQPEDTATVTVPKGWAGKALNADLGSYTLTNMWYAPGPLTGDNIDLGYSQTPTAMQFDALVATTRDALEKFSGQKLLADHAEKVCGATTNAWFFEVPMTMGAYTMVTEEVLVAGKSRVFATAYTRRSTHAEDQGARKALDTICVHSS